MKLLILFLLLPFASLCQSIDTTLVHQKSLRTTTPSVPSLQRMNSLEICDNQKDDDGNGLIDDKDYGCYFSPTHNDCSVSKIIWLSSNWGLHWADVETGTERFVGKMDLMTDIEWASDGNLYGVDYIKGLLWEINPATAQTRQVMEIQGYYAANAMTSDASGNLFLATVSTTGQRDVIKLELATGKVTRVANLNQHNLTSSGDLAFLNGFLYLTCEDQKLAKINTTTGVAETLFLKSPAPDRNFGLVNLGDGNLYVACLDKLYKLDLSTLTLTPSYRFTYPDIFIMGAANYSNQCNAPGCKAKVQIEVESAQPYCSQRGVQLKAKGQGIMGSQGYIWTLPNGTTVNGQTLTATFSGKYQVRYHTLPDTCGQVTTLELDILSPPTLDFGADTLLCLGNSLTLKVQNPNPYTTYSWPDGSHLPSFMVSSPGAYTLQASNACGKTSKTIMVHQITPPEAYLGRDTLICPGVSLLLSNQKAANAWNEARWWNQSTSSDIQVSDAGSYWLEVSNKCGKVWDTVIVALKDSCTCFPLYPVVNLGMDKQLCSYDTLVLRNAAHNSAFHYIWQNGSGSESLTIKKPGLYWLEATTYCGTMRDSILITEKQVGCERTIYVPTAFTPNRDSKNDQLHPTVVGRPTFYSFAVFNRWGEKVFETNDPEGGWDGTYKGKPQESGVYAWSCQLQFDGLERKQHKGTILLIR